MTNQNLTAIDWYRKHKLEVRSKILGKKHTNFATNTSKIKTHSSCIGNTEPANKYILFKSNNVKKDCLVVEESSSDRPIQWVELTSYLLITSSATAVLVSSALEVFGYSWEGWIKALLLEIGIISLVSMRTTSFIKKVGLSTGLCFLVLLSFFVLHTGVKASQDELTIELVTNDTVIKSLKAEKDRYLENHDSLPLTHVTKRTALMTKVSELNEKIQRYTTKINTTASSVDLKAYSEVLVRAALLMLNLIFGHKLLTLIAHTNWNALRQA